MPTFYCNYFFCLELGGPLHSGAPWTLPTLPTPLLRHCRCTYNRKVVRHDCLFILKKITLPKGEAGASSPKYSSISGVVAGGARGYNWPPKFWAVGKMSKNILLV